MDHQLYAKRLHLDEMETIKAFSGYDLLCNFARNLLQYCAGHNSFSKAVVFETGALVVRT